MDNNGLELYRVLEDRLLDKMLLRHIGVSKKDMSIFLGKKSVRGAIEDRLIRKYLEKEDPSDLSYGDLIDLFAPIVKRFSAVPKGGWMEYLCETTVMKLFGDKGMEEDPDYAKGELFLWTLLDAFSDFKRESEPFSPTRQIVLLTEEELEGCDTRDEYRRFLRRSKDMHLFTFLMLEHEHLGYDTVGHIFGVHFVAMHVARQLQEAGQPVDLALISAAALTHDIGKFGCKGEEAKRIPYLHYYYTDKCLTRHGMPTVAHIASNHSTWDLEPENLSLESLLLIYADFRVKSIYEDGKETVIFYSMEEAFDVILGKLDNVDEKKKARYQRVYSKIKDFENFMKACGVSVYLDRSKRKETKWVDPALLKPQQAVDRMKYLAIRYNIGVMYRLRNEAAFGDILEEARSAHQWNQTRAYLSMMEEYCTYLTMRQKQMTLQYLKELLVNREGDVRRQAAALIGRIIADYQEHYRKEVPKDVDQDMGIAQNIRVWEEHVRYVMEPDPQFTEEQRRWMGYTLKISLNSLLEASQPQDRKAYAEAYFSLMRKTPLNGEEGIFIFLDTVSDIPLELMEQVNVNSLIVFIKKVLRRSSAEVRIAALVTLLRLTEPPAIDRINADNLAAIDDMTKMRIEEDTPTSAVYLLACVRTAMGFEDEQTYRATMALEKRYRETSEIFRDNLKVNTPWIIKTVNIRFLLDAVLHGKKGEVFFTAAHLANLLKVSERITVRHMAGRGLLEVMERLDLEQRNEIAVELTRGLEIGNLQFSKYIPEYLGQIALMLHPSELDELIGELKMLLINGSDKTASVTLETLGVILSHYASYQRRFDEEESVYEERRKTVLGLLLSGMANYRPVVSQEALMVLGHYVFGSPHLGLSEKYDMYKILYKKVLILLSTGSEVDLPFFYNAAALNHFYRFITDYVFYKGPIKLTTPGRIAFFPGTFDPFSLSHKGIVTTIRDMGYEVYLAIDEFSWSKKTQPRGVRRNIIAMTMANEENVYVFPEDRPINIANENDLTTLTKIFPKDKMYMVVGSDVVSNASTYRLPKTENSIHTFNHLVFRRRSTEDGSGSYGEKYKKTVAKIDGDVVELHLPMQLEDISSTKIRANIDENRDISSLIDPVAQNYIYEYGLYKREPQFKSVAHRSDIRLTTRMVGSHVRETRIFDSNDRKKSLGSVRTSRAFNQDLLASLEDRELAAYIRQDAPGRILMIRDFEVAETFDRDYLADLLLTEMILKTLEKGFSYALYRSHGTDRTEREKLALLKRMGFQEIELDGRPTGCYTVSMHNPVVFFHDMETVLKDPFDKNERVIRAIQKAKVSFQEALVRLYPGALVLAIDTPVMNQRIIEKITRENGVSNVHSKRGKRGPYMCVPFGKILNGLVVPNTVTKTLHIQKFFSPGLESFTIRENQFYASIDNQVNTIRSFHRPIILVDDLLHKGYRMQRLDPLLKKWDVTVQKIVVGLISGRGMDLMNEQGRDVESVYYVPNLRVWFTESLEYPFIGGDAMTRGTGTYDDNMRAINLIMPYVLPPFLRDRDLASVMDFSMTCLTNARSIFRALEEAYQDIYQRKMTLRRVPEAIRFSRLPDVGACLDYDLNLAPSEYISTDIERLDRLRGGAKADGRGEDGRGR